MAVVEALMERQFNIWAINPADGPLRDRRPAGARTTAATAWSWRRPCAPIRIVRRLGATDPVIELRDRAAENSAPNHPSHQSHA
ncbi:MAG: hypothetical protein U1E21_07850 [Reyranellaceae bacterium]